MRLFIAIPFDPPVLDALVAAQSSLKASCVRGNFTTRQNLHMTLAFLGEVRDPRPVIAVLERVSLPQVSLRFDKTEMFRDIFVCGFAVDPALANYVKDVRNALERAGIDFDRKPFRPHVTLVRRTSFALGKPDVSVCEPFLRSLDVPVRRVCLMRTDFIDGRPKYTCMHTASFKESGHDEK